MRSGGGLDLQRSVDHALRPDARQLIERRGRRRPFICPLVLRGAKLLLVKELGMDLMVHITASTRRSTS